MGIAMRSLAPAVLIGLLAATGAHAATFGNPIIVERERSVSVGFETEYVDTKITDDQVSSKRYLGNGIYKANRWLDLSFSAGAGDIDVTSELAGNTIPMNTEPGFAWGLGARVEAWKSENHRLMPSLVVAGKGLFIHASGVEEFNLNFPTATLREKFEADYNWSEFQGTAALVLRMSRVFPYAGVMVRGVDGDVRRVQTDISGSIPSVVSDEEGEFGSSATPYFLTGFDFRVSPIFRLSAEGYVNDGDDYGFFFGFSESTE